MDQGASNRKTKRNIACDECKRRKVRCSAEPTCADCARHGKVCIYSSPSHRVTALQQTIRHYETLLTSISKAWKTHLPNLPLEQALSNETGPITASDSHATPQEAPPTASAFSLLKYGSTDAASSSDLGTPEQSNAEDYEFDESQDFGNAIDGMGFLTAEASKAGYTGPQSGIAALKFLRSLPSGYQDDSGDGVLPVSNGLAEGMRANTNVDSFINDYFAYYHPAYPLLHEGLFRARLSGAVAKPRDGSWPLLFNMVVAMGAFAGDSTDSDVDIQYYQVARNSISLDITEKGSLCYVQGLTVMANYLQKRNKPNAGFALIGIAWSMALAIGLHREFGASSTTPYTMEQRRRTWWTLFVFVSGAQLTLGRPPASLVGINLRLPTNLDDASLSVDMSEVPGAQEGATISTCLIAQVRLAQIANEVQTELLSNQVPTSQRVEVLRNQIKTWQAELPPCFDEGLSYPTWFELPKRVLLWRSSHLRIVLDRPLLFRAVTDKVDLSICEGPVWECINTADHCILEICNFLESNDLWRRGFAWYATYWLVSASFVHAVCFAYSPPSRTKEQWRTRLQQAVSALQKLRTAHRKAGQAERVLGRLL
ncbi:hypothetical protein M409DRAFT_31606, partial [Zasmidium cellare ATCC 36951]